MSISRRTMLRSMAAGSGAAVAAALPAPSADAAERDASDAVGMLYDATLCIGCKACMVACNRANDLPPDTATSDGRWQMPVDLNAQTKTIIKAYRDPESGAASFVKRQCMHCVDPACTSACMLGALAKRELGIVSYDPSLCIGCRYCEMACPFNVPKFEWYATFPKIVKCELCRPRIADGQLPACCEVCPAQAIIYGKRADLLAEAHQRLAAHPDRYLPKVYGEHELGGTQVLYLASVDFAKLGLPAYGDAPVPSTVRSVQRTAYQGFVTPVVLYGVLAGVMLRNRRHGTTSCEEEHS